MNKTDLQQVIQDAGKLLEKAQPSDQDILKAEKAIEYVMQYDRGNAGLAFMMGTVRMRQGRWALAEHWMRHTLETQPKMVEAVNNLAFCLDQLGDRKESLKMFKKAQKLRPEDPALLNNIATAMVNNGTPDKAIELCDQALAIDDNSADAHWNRGLAYLEKGNWEKGWQDYKWGLNLTGSSSQQRKIRHYKEVDATPYWEGTAGKSVVIYSEQGVGDEILATSMLDDAAADANVTLESHPRLVNIMRHNFGDKMAVYGTRKMPWEGLAFPSWTKIDAKAPIFSLGGIYRNSAEKFPRAAYLSPYEDKVEKYIELMDLQGERPRIGIAWQGGSYTTRVDLRSVPLVNWIPLMKSIDATWVSLQYDPADHPGVWAPIVDDFNRDTGLNLIHWQEPVNDLDECYGGMIHALDLVICVNTSLVHACGAFGVDCWTLTPSRPAWRYQTTGEHMAWYGDWVRQFRQKGDDWSAVLKRVESELQSRAWEAAA